MLHTSRLGIDAIAEEVRTIGPTQEDFDRLLEMIDEHPTVDWMQGKNAGSHYPDGQQVPCMINLAKCTKDQRTWYFKRCFGGVDPARLVAMSNNEIIEG